jgi:hypothetical protein
MKTFHYTYKVNGDDGVEQGEGAYSTLNDKMTSSQAVKFLRSDLEDTFGGKTQYVKVSFVQTDSLAKK